MMGTEDGGPRHGRVLVAGVSGSLGRTVATVLVKAGWTVRGISRGAGELGDAKALSRWTGVADLRFGDLADMAVARAACEEVATVVFAAGSSGVAASFNEPIADLEGNAIPWLNMLHACEAGTRIVLLSSQLVYGPAVVGPFREQDALHPNSPYALHRMLLEQYGRLFASRLQLEIVVLRLGNVFGEVLDATFPRQHGLVERILCDLSLNGAAVLYGGGTQTVELLSTGDLAQAVLAVVSETSPTIGLTTYNLHGTRLSVLAVAEALRDGLGRGEIRQASWPDGMETAMAKDIELDDSAFRRRYGWVPTEDVTARLCRLARPWSARSTEDG